MRMGNIGYLIAIGILILGLGGFWVYQNHGNIFQIFAGHISHERYMQAAAMIMPPCAIEEKESGDLLVVDNSGKKPGP